MIGNVSPVVGMGRVGITRDCAARRAERLHRQLAVESSKKSRRAVSTYAAGKGRTSYLSIDVFLTSASQRRQ